MADGYEIDLNDEDDGYTRYEDTPMEEEYSEQQQQNITQRSDTPYQQQQQQFQPQPQPSQPQNYRPVTGRPPIESSSALLIKNMDWWVNEEEVRGWAVDANVEKHIKTVLFDDYKQNARSKGVVYVELDSVDPSKQLKNHLDSITPKPTNSEGYERTVVYTIPSPRPFKFVKNANTPPMSGRGRGRGGAPGAMMGMYPQQQVAMFQNYPYYYNQYPQWQQGFSNPNFNYQIQQQAQMMGDNPHGLKRQRNFH